MLDMLRKVFDFFVYGTFLIFATLTCGADVTRDESAAMFVANTVKAAEESLAILRSINDRRSADMQALEYYNEASSLSLYLFNYFDPDFNKAATRKLTGEIGPSLKKERKRIRNADFYGSQLLEKAFDLDAVVTCLYEQRAEKSPDKELEERAKAVGCSAVRGLEGEFYSAFEALTRPDEIRKLTQEQRENCANYLVRLYFTHYSVKSARSLIGLKNGNVYESEVDKKKFNEQLSKIRKNVKELSELDFFGIKLYKGIVQKIVEQDVDGAEEK